MKELVRVTEENGKQLVSARELHEFLEVKDVFRSWSKRMFEYGFEENKDYSKCEIAQPDNQAVKNPNPKIDYALTIDCAKEISMIQRTDKGKQARTYFIECEKKLQLQLPQTYAEALRAYADEIEKKELAEVKVQGLEQSLDVSEQWISIIRASKEYGVHETFFNWRKLKEYSIDNGIEVKKAPCPRFGTKNLYHVSVFKNVYQELKIKYLK